MDCYAIRRRSLCRPEEIEAVDARSQAELARRTGRIRKVRSYIFEEGGGLLGSMCVYEAEGPEIIAEHARAAGLPCDEVVRVSGLDVARPDPEPAPGHG